MYIQNYTCITAAGLGVSDLMSALYSGRDCSVPAQPVGRVCFLNDQENKKASFSGFLKSLSLKLWADLFGQLDQEIKNKLRSSKVGLVFASTKGDLEDYIWSCTPENIRGHRGPFSQFLEDFEVSECEWSLKCNMSNACASSHFALEYVQELMNSQRLDFALVVAADLVGPFVYKGFSALKVVSPTTNRPFSVDRDGLQLGEGVAMVLVAKNAFEQNRTDDRDRLRISFVATDTEGALITRPSTNGLGLARAICQIQNRVNLKPDLVIAHGTGTKFNDLTEDSALHQVFHAAESSQVPITNTKWCVGHTLGASGLVDLIAACEILRRQKVFRIGNTVTKDPRLKMNYVIADSQIDKSKGYKQILICSLGFGGVHAALVVQKSDS